MILVASANGDVGMDAGWEILARGGSALDAVEAATRLVEDNPDDHTVGYGGYPNALGEVELDASIMEGRTRRAGAVGALKGHRAAITVARAVMERTPHVLLVGDGAARLAAEIGLEEENLLTAEAEQAWREHVAKGPAGTVDFLAVDREGRIASAVSTSGWAWKHPGRVGDSAVIGAGNCCDDRWGAAACTGFGELAIRASLARMVVARLALGHDLEQSCAASFRELDGPEPIMSMVAIDAAGGHCGVSTLPDRTYLVRTDAMSAHEALPRLHVEV